MRNFCCGLCAFVLGFAVVPAQVAFGQTPAAAPAQVEVIPAPSWLANDIACAPGLTKDPKVGPRVIGSQDTVVKHMLGPGDTLVIGAGSNAGLQPGQRFFVRRHIKSFGAVAADPRHAVSVHTAGWVQILGVDTAVSTASIIYACDGILLDDYLEPFTAPMIAARVVPGNTPQYANMGHILMGDEGIQNVAAAGQMINIDRGSDVGVVLGQRYLVFRDKRSMSNRSGDYSIDFAVSAVNMPLVEVGEVLVVAVRPDHSTVQVLMAKDTITEGDFIAEIR